MVPFLLILGMAAKVEPWSRSYTVVIHAICSRRDSRSPRMMREPPLRPNQPTTSGKRVVLWQFQQTDYAMASISGSAGDTPHVPFVVPFHVQGEITSFGLFKPNLLCLLHFFVPSLYIQIFFFFFFFFFFLLGIQFPISRQSLGG